MFHRRKWIQILCLIVVILVILMFRGLFQDEYSVRKHVNNVEITSPDHFFDQKPAERSRSGDKYVPMECKINQEVRKNVGLVSSPSNGLEKSVKCISDKNHKEVFVPFSYVKKYFDIYGQIATNSKSVSLVWSHSYSKVYPQFKSDVYDPGGSFMQFASFDVENRPRVKCVSARDNVPITTQWDKAGYYYATQICQFGLSHWSKAQSMTEEVLVLENGNFSTNGAAWKNADIMRVLRDKCVHFDQPLALNLEAAKIQGLHVISFDLLIRDSPVVTLSLNSQDHGTYNLQYSSAISDDINKVGKTILFGFGNTDGSPLPEGLWKNFTRNMVSDLAKGIAINQPSIAGSIRKSSWTLKEIQFTGVGCVTNIGLSKTQHIKMFLQAAQWLMENQDPNTGAWHVPVAFNQNQFKYSLADEIPPGWISSMGSAHAMSVLTRAYRETGNEEFLQASAKAIKVFSIPTSQGGVEARFMQSKIWFEEYPTHPNSFVLNGFMYSLLGLYDLWQTSSQVLTMESVAKESQSLFEQGLKSLVSMAPLFDTGSGSTYDLRHFSMGGPPKLARWDYHSTHVNLLYVLSTISTNEDQKTALRSLGDRWQHYMLGDKAEHN